jgi:hypothetical protein
MKLVLNVELKDVKNLLGRRGVKNIMEENEIIKTRPVAYVIADAVFDEPFEVYESANAWWMDKEKVLALIEGFKVFRKANKAIILAKISFGQYQYFIDTHPKFLQLKARCIDYFDMQLQNKILRSSDWKASAWMLEKTNPSEFGRNGGDSDPLRESSSSILTLVKQSFLDKDGNIIGNEHVIELIEKELKNE